MKITLKGSELIAILFPQEYGKSKVTKRATILKKYGFDEKNVRAIERALKKGKWKIL